LIATQSDRKKEGNPESSRRRKISQKEIRKAQRKETKKFDCTRGALKAEIYEERTLIADLESRRCGNFGRGEGKKVTANRRIVTLFPAGAAGL